MRRVRRTVLVSSQASVRERVVSRTRATMFAFWSRCRMQVRRARGSTARLTIGSVISPPGSGAGGALEFIEVPPGRYVVGVDLTRTMDPKVIYPTTFYPDTPDPKRATVIQVDGGEAHEGLSLTVLSARRSYRLTGAVVFEDGS